VELSGTPYRLNEKEKTQKEMEDIVAPCRAVAAKYKGWHTLSNALLWDGGRFNSFVEFWPSHFIYRGWNGSWSPVDCRCIAFDNGFYFHQS